MVHGNRSGTARAHIEPVAVGPADSYVQVKPVTDGYLLMTRYEFPMMAPTDQNFKWRGARGVRVLHNSATDLRVPGAAGEALYQASAVSLFLTLTPTASL